MRAARSRRRMGTCPPPPDVRRTAAVTGRPPRRLHRHLRFVRDVRNVLTVPDRVAAPPKATRTTTTEEVRTMATAFAVLATALLGALAFQGWLLVHIRGQQARLHRRLDALARRAAAARQVVAPAAAAP